MGIVRSERGRVTIVIMIVAALVVFGVLGLIMFYSASTSAVLDRDLASAQAEEARLEHVTRRVTDLMRTAGELRAEIVSRFGEAAAPPPCADPGPLPVGLPRVDRPTALFPGDPGLAARRQELDARTAAIQRGINLEKRLPDLERCVADLEARLAALPPAPAATAP